MAYQLNQDIDPQSKVNLHEHGHQKEQDRISLSRFIPNTISGGFVKIYIQEDKVTFCDKEGKEKTKKTSTSRAQGVVKEVFSFNRKIFIIGKDTPVLFDAVSGKKLDVEYPKHKGGLLEEIVPLEDETFICMYDLYHKNKTVHLYHFDYNGAILKEKVIKRQANSKIYCDINLAYLEEEGLTLIDLKTFEIIKDLKNVTGRIGSRVVNDIRPRLEHFFKDTTSGNILRFDKNGNSDVVNSVADAPYEFNMLVLTEEIKSKTIVNDGKEQEIELVQYKLKRKDSNKLVFESPEFERELKGSFKTIGYYPTSCTILSENSVGVYFGSRFQFDNARYGFFRNAYSVYEF